MLSSSHQRAVAQSPVLRNAAIFDDRTATQIARDAFRSALPEVVVESPHGFALLPTDAPQIQVVLKVANHLARHGLLPERLLPTAQDKNWGYRIGPRGGIPLSLAKLSRIEVVDRDEGVISVEPGVTQQQLYDFLWNELAGRFIPPVSGSGPNTSVLGNALERGFGLLPVSSHFRAISSLSFFPGSGEDLIELRHLNVAARPHYPYASPFDLMQFDSYAGATQALHEMRLEEMRAQAVAENHYRGSFGVVSKIELCLRPRPLITAQITFDVMRSEEGVSVFRALKRLSAEYNGVNAGTVGSTPIIGSFSLSNDLRQLPLRASFPRAAASLSEPLPVAEARQLVRANQIAPWQVVINIFADEHRRGPLREVLARLRGDTSPHGANYKLRLFGELPSGVIARSRARLDRHRLFSGFEVERMASSELGRPDEQNLRTAYWRSAQPAPDRDLDPGRDRCGIRWGKFIGPDHLVGRMAEIIGDTYLRYGFDPMIRILAIELHRAHCVCPMTYPDSPENRARSRECYLELFDKAAEIGFQAHGLPYDIEGEYPVQRAYLEELWGRHATSLNSSFAVVPFPHPLRKGFGTYLPSAEVRWARDLQAVLSTLDPLEILPGPAPLFSRAF